MADFQSGPLYFFDQSKRQGRTRGSRVHEDHFFDLTNARAHSAGVKSVCTHIQDTEEVNTGDAHKWQTKACTTGQPDIPVNGVKNRSSSGERDPEAPARPADCPADVNPIDPYMHVAPHLLTELGALLVRFQGCEAEYIPYGLLNVLNYSHRDLTAGAVYTKPCWHLGVGRGSCDDGIPRRSRAGPNLEENIRPMTGKKKTKTKPSKLENGSEIHLASKLCKRASISHENKAQEPPTISFSISSKTCKEQGWTVQLKEPGCGEQEFQWTDLCQWIVERLKLARISMKQQTKEQAEKGMNKPPILRHYGEAKPLIKNQKKKMGGINDRTSFIYYISGQVAVCQSHSALPGGGFYTNVFSDQFNPVILASVTASGRGSVTHQLSGAVTGVWDQNGGQTSDPNGEITKKWTWPRPTDSALKDSIVIQVCDQISVRLLSGTCAVLIFRSQNEMVQLLLCPFSHQVLQEDTVQVRSSEMLQTALEGSKREEPFQGETGLAERELRRLQGRVFKILDNWLEFYRISTGIKCPDIKRMPDDPVRPRQKKVIQSSALASLNSTEGMSDSTMGLPVKDNTKLKLQTNLRHQPLSLPESVPLPGSTNKLSRTLTQKNQQEEEKEELLHFCLSGASKVHKNFQPELCPAQLRAFLTGEESQKPRLCRCSSRLMPALTDLEYDTFIQGQPPHGEQVLVVCVDTPLDNHTSTQPNADVLERLYQRRNRNRTMPCYQSQLDSFRLVRYELSAGKPSPDSHNTLLQQRYHVAPGMFLMYVRGQLLFADYIFRGNGCSVRDLQKQISKTRVLYRIGQSLHPDDMFSSQVKSPVSGDTACPQTAQKASGAGGHIHPETPVLLKKY
ncbi:hypothetical protein DPEC_G00160900 [Dallia pectoralis]|uniref:Uncharacterized protein n=1 Tax=Dallia pectoralis TaxID=75939 RepID=A0ACC2GGE9_DALPE|nr:hypothetical protein DPEC_G00160900 [Dallia pectoralis]